MKWMSSWPRASRLLRRIRQSTIASRGSPSRARDLLRQAVLGFVELEADVGDFDRHRSVRARSAQVLSDRSAAASEADQGDVVDLDVAGGELADVLEDRPADGFRAARWSRRAS